MFSLFRKEVSSQPHSSHDASVAGQVSGSDSPKIAIGLRLIGLNLWNGNSLPVYTSTLSSIRPRHHFAGFMPAYGTDKAMSAILRYTLVMETIVRNVRDLHDSERSAAEQLVGHSLRENQQLVIKVVSVDMGAETPPVGGVSNALPAWCNVYDGLTDDEIAELEKAILVRADLSRPSD